MATDKPISAFTLLASGNVEPTDLAIIVDVSDTSSSSSGTTKSVLLSSILNNPNNGVVTGKLVPIRGLATAGQIINTAQNGIVAQSTGGTLTDYAFLSSTGTQIAAMRASDSALIGGKLMGVSVAPTVAVGAAAGSGATASVVGSDSCGVITLNTGSGTTTGTIVTLTFSNPYGNGVVGQVQYGASGGPNYPVLSTTAIAATLTVAVLSGSNLSTSGTYLFNYQVMGYGN